MNILYALETSNDYENFYATCPYCNHNNIFNRMSDLETTRLITFKSVECLNENCNKTFNINGDTATPAYKSLIFECVGLLKRKKYSYCILSCAQAFEVFFSSFLTVNLIYKPFKNNSYRTKEINDMISKLNSAIEKFGYFKMRNIFFHMVIKDIKPSSFQESAAFIDNINSFVTEPSITYINSVSDVSKLDILNKIKASNISTLRNKVVHKVAYRPSIEEATEAILESEDILFSSSRIFDIDKHLYFAM